MLRCLATSRQQLESVKTNERSSDNVRGRATTERNHRRAEQATTCRQPCHRGLKTTKLSDPPWNLTHVVVFEAYTDRFMRLQYPPHRQVSSILPNQTRTNQEPSLVRKVVASSFLSALVENRYGHRVP
jgi:hypothetical protein